MFTKKLGFKKLILKEDVFYPFFLDEVKNIVIGLATSPRIGDVKSGACAYHIGMSGCQDIQPVIKFPNYPMEIYLPHSWHVTMSGKVEGTPIYITSLPLDQIKEEDWKEGKIFKVHPLILRTMIAIYGQWITPIEHGIPMGREARRWRNPFNNGLSFAFPIEGGQLRVEPSPIQKKVTVITTGTYSINSELKIRKVYDVDWNSTIPAQLILLAENKDRGKFALYRRYDIVSNRGYYSAFFLSKSQGCTFGFEKGQAGCRLPIETWDNLVEKDLEYRRLGDFLFLPAWMEKFEGIIALSQEEILKSKLEFVGDERQGIIYHPDHGGLRIDRDDKAYQLTYLERGHD